MLSSSSVTLICVNTSFWAAFCAWLAAQCTKMLCHFIKVRRIDLGFLLSLGGMPSAHTSMVAALATSVGLNAGFETPVFAITFGFALITMFDASTVRAAAGHQARLLNQIVNELFKEHKLSDQKLAELLDQKRSSPDDVKEPAAEYRAG